jgi:hypothetical protein
MQAFHEQAPSFEQSEMRTGEQGLPPQQFSLRKFISEFIAVKLAA